MSQLDLSAIKFWAKTTEDDLPGISVLHHMMNVGLVAENLIQHYPHLLKRFNMNTREAALLAALHDIGKISQGFQSKCAKWLEQTGMKEISTAQGWQNFEKRIADAHAHAKVSQFTVQNLLLQEGKKAKSATHWAVASGAHHGYLQPPQHRTASNQERYSRHVLRGTGCSARL